MTIKADGGSVGPAMSLNKPQVEAKGGEKAQRVGPEFGRPANFNQWRIINNGD
jgi:hypothetical protein